MKQSLNERNILTAIMLITLIYFLGVFFKLQLITAFTGFFNTLFGVGTVIYLVIFPEKEIELIELMSFSFCLSISIPPLISLILHYVLAIKLTFFTNVLLISGLILAGAIIRLILSKKYVYRDILILK